MARTYADRLNSAFEKFTSGIEGTRFAIAKPKGKTSESLDYIVRCPERWSLSDFEGAMSDAGCKSKLIGFDALGSGVIRAEFSIASKRLLVTFDLDGNAFSDLWNGLMPGDKIRSDRPFTEEEQGRERSLALGESTWIEPRATEREAPAREIQEYVDSSFFSKGNRRICVRDVYYSSKLNKLNIDTMHEFMDNIDRWMGNQFGLKVDRVLQIEFEGCPRPLPNSIFLTHSGSCFYLSEKPFIAKVKPNRMPKIKSAS